MDRVLPTFLIVGAPKAATSSLWEYLRGHPAVFLPEQKELDFFSDDKVFARGVDWYGSLFSPGEGHKALGEASPEYMFSKDAPARMSSVVPDARLIAILRNPIDRAYSHYLHARFFAMDKRSFRDAVEEERRAPDEMLFPFYLARSRYYPQLARLTQHFPREQLLVLFVEDLKKDPVAVFQTLCRHIGVDETIVPANVGQSSNRYRELKAPRLWRAVLRPAVRDRVIPAIPPQIWSRIVRLSTRNDRSPPPIEPELRRDLAAYFAEDNAALAEWLGRDLSSWS